MDRRSFIVGGVAALCAPPAARAAFEKSAVDAWVIWEPYRAAAETELGARTLADGTSLVSNHEFYFVTKSFAEAHLR